MYTLYNIMCLNYFKINLMLRIFNIILHNNEKHSFIYLNSFFIFNYIKHCGYVLV